MIKTKILAGIIIGIILLAGLVISQVAGVNFPASFSITLPNLPQPQSSNQLIFVSCPYILPIDNPRIDVHSYSLTGEIDATLRISTGRGTRISECSLRKTWNTGMALSSNQAVANFQNRINIDLLEYANNNTQPFNPQPPVISVGSSP